MTNLEENLDVVEKGFSSRVKLKENRVHLCARISVIRWLDYLFKIWLVASMTIG